MYVHLLVEWVLRPDVKPVVSMSILNHIVSLSQVLPRFFSCLGKATRYTYLIFRLSNFISVNG